MLKKSIFLCVLCLFSINCICALTFPWNGKPEVVGKIQFYQTQVDEGIPEVARRFGIGYDNLLLANPNVSPPLPINESFEPIPETLLMIPTRFLIPAYHHKRGIVVNVAAKRLYYFDLPHHEVSVFPVGAGRENWQTPLGRLKIKQKIKNPYWIVPDSIMAFRKKKGDPVSKIVKAGPDNPLGDFALRLSNPTYLIHGTNEPEGVGRRSSAGCIRLYPESIKQLFARVSVGTPVQIINQPIVVAQVNGTPMMQVYPVFIEQKKQGYDVSKKIIALLANLPKPVTLDSQSIDAQARLSLGMPVAVN